MPTAGCCREWLTIQTGRYVLERRERADPTNAAPDDPMAMRRLARVGHSTEVLAFPKSGSSQAVLAGLCLE